MVLPGSLEAPVLHKLLWWDRRWAQETSLAALGFLFFPSWSALRKVPAEVSPATQGRNGGSSLSRGTRRGPPFPGPTHAGWTPAGPGLSSQWAAHRRRWRRRGSSSSTQTEPGTRRIPASPSRQGQLINNHISCLATGLGSTGEGRPYLCDKWCDKGPHSRHSAACSQTQSPGCRWIHL